MVNGRPMEPHHELISEAQREEKQNDYLARLRDIVDTCSNFRNALEQFRVLEEERSEKESWEQYTRCDGLPKANAPDLIRTFLSKIRYYEDVEATKSTDWTLSVNERSVLTQNTLRKDLTRRFLENTIRVSPGPYFEVNSRNCLEVLRQVDVLMGNETEIVGMDLNKLFEIMEVYKEIQREIESLFDRLTYRVLGMQKATMQSDDGVVAMWSHSCDPWRMDLWGLLNVPIIFSKLEIPVLVAELPATRVRVQMPQSVFTDCLTLRCVHTSFDHYSTGAKSYEQNIIDPESVPSCGNTDMETSLISEWQMQQDIQEEVLTEMHRKREEYEELMQLIAERTQEAAKEEKKDKDSRIKIVIPKTPKTVVLVPPGMFPEVYDEFLEREEALNHSFMENYYHPRHLNLWPTEINLRQHIMIGGIYSITFVERPLQTQFQQFNIILHHDGRVLRIIPDVVAEVELPSDSRWSSPISNFKRGTKVVDNNVRLGDNELPYFIVTIKLAPDLCKWGLPQVCHFLTESQRLSRKSRIGFGSTLSTLSSLYLESPVHASNYNIFAPTLKSILRQSVRDNQMDLKHISGMDFSLDKPLDKLEIRTLEEQCLPRLLSSCKFPNEFNEEAAHDMNKSKPNRLIKRFDQAEIAEVLLTSDKFDYDMQDDPERAFPHFQSTVPIEIRSSFLVAEYDTSSARGVVDNLEQLKQHYLQRPEKLLLQKESSLIEKKKEKKVERSELPERQAFKDWGIRHSTISQGARKSSIINPRKRPSRKPSKPSVSSQTECSIKSLEPVTVNHWTTQYIFDANVDAETNTLTFKTDRLGMFGLAFKRYEHFPFRDWCLQPNEDNPDEVILSLDTHHVRMFFYISSLGVRGYVTDLTKGYTANPVKYLDIKEPISDIGDLRKTLVDKNLSIFAENDACYYISNGYFSIKHAATEMHTYNTMALHCKSMKFYRSSWNRLAPRRDLLMDMKIAKDTSDFTKVTLRITPEKTTFVKVSELCSDNINNVKLSYEETWRNVNNYMDLNQAIHSINLQAQDGCNKAAKLFVNIMKLLSEIRPLSYS